MKAKWSSSDAVRGRILDAALNEFQERGYASATMTDIVQSSGASIGSIYHHVGGKEDLFSACYDRLRTALLESIEIDPEGAMPEPGTWEEGYLRAVHEDRAACMVFLSVDTPPGFELSKSIAAYYAGLGDHAPRILAAILIEAMRILCECSDDEVTHVIDATVKLLNVVRAVGF